jgi:hypothetical protein
MAGCFTTIRWLAAILCATLLGCVVTPEELDEAALTGEDEETIASISQAAKACATSATFKYSTSGDITTAKIGVTEVAWFTKGAYTVRMAGPSRTFMGGLGVPVVTTTMWVRTLITPFDPAVMSIKQRGEWLNAARAVNCATGAPDILAIAYEYIEGSTNDPGYEFGADFHDYLGIDWDPPDTSVVEADPAQLGKLDCSGYMRLVFGERTSFVHDGRESRIPLSMYQEGFLPRSSKDQYHAGSGKILVPFRTEPAGAPAFDGEPTPEELDAIQVGDLVFFDTNCDYTVATPSCGADWTSISHVGLHVGRDILGDHRFLSSRIVADGPTVANAGGWSVFNAAIGVGGTYPKRFRAARRL